MNQIQETLDSMKGKKLPNKTLFGDLQGIVRETRDKFYNQDNPPPRLQKFYHQDDYQHCGFYNCKFYGNRLERIKHVKNQHTIKK